ncbi:MAG: HTH domain-containing protein [Chloroflexi bacterium]|nr:HTH domain-containing protein [Chloroflexota bacterium]
MQGTRGEILEFLKKKGTATVDEMAEALGVTSTAIRQHLAILERETLITAREARRKIGRPQHVYSLTNKAHDLYPKSYHLLTSWILDEIKALDGEGKTTQIFTHIAARWAKVFMPRLEGKGLEERIAEVTAIMKEDGYTMDWGKTDSGYFIHHYDCRFHCVAQTHPEVCFLEHSLLTKILGSPVEMTSCLFTGDRCCTYVISPNAAK